jgi:hypothetical protein
MWKHKKSSGKMRFKEDKCIKICPKFIKNKTSYKFGKAKWLEFSEKMLEKGLEVYVYESKTSVSKYLYIFKNNYFIKVRFSQHKDVRGGNDFVVGPKGISTKTLLNKMDSLLERVYEI